MSISNILNNGQNIYDEVQVFDTYTVYGNRNPSLPWESWIDMVAARGGTLLIDVSGPPQLYAVQPPKPGPDPLELLKIPQGSPSIQWLLSLPEGPSLQPGPWKPFIPTPVTFGSCPPGYPCWDSFNHTPNPASGGSPVPEPSQGFLLMFSIFFVLIAAKLRPKESR